MLSAHADLPSARHTPVQSCRHHQLTLLQAFICISELSAHVQPLVLERIPSAETGRAGGPAAWQHTKALYRLSSESRLLLQVELPQALLLLGQSFR